MTINIRNFIRHPTSIPIRVESKNKICRDATMDISKGGVSLVSKDALHIGELVEITIDFCNPAFIAQGIVRWCKKEQGQFSVGVSFQDEMAAYALRMIEQICHIENYRQDQFIKTGELMSNEQAAHEWIIAKAASFKQAFY
jgi:c-di-GMP-binding flagellar brake protein YcgR